MWALEVIKEKNKRAASKARAAKTKLFAPKDAEDVDPASFRENGGIPMIGDHRPEGWELIDTWFVDISGFGTDREPALTQHQLLERIRCHVMDGKGYGYALIEHAQFQGYVGVFAKKGEGERCSTPSSTP